MSEAPGANPPPSGAPPASRAPNQTAVSGEEQALVMARDLVDKGAPWKAGVRWPIVMAEGVVLAIAGLLVWLAPGFGARTVLQILGIILLATALLSAWRLLRDRVPPRRVMTVAFRAGVGLTVGLIVVIGSLIAEDSDVATVAIAVILGIGLILYGVAAIATSVLRREPGEGLPVAALAIAGLTVVVGLLLVLGGRDIDALKSSFTWLGILLLIVGLGLVGYAWMLRSHGGGEPAD